METKLLKANEKSIELACNLLRNGEIVAVPTATTYVGDSVRKTITAYEKGTTLLTVYSNETGKTSKITVNVVKVASSIGFKNDNLALPSVIGSKLKLDDSYIQTYPERSDITNVSYQIKNCSAFLDRAIYFISPNILTHT